MENINLIQDYLQGNLSDEEKNQFRERLRNEPNLMEEYNAQKQMHIYLIDNNSRDQYTAHLNQLGDKYFPSDKKTTSSSNQFKPYILAAIILLASLASFYFYNKKSQNIYESHSNHFALHLVQKSIESETALNAENAFNSGRFDIAKVALEKYLIKNNMDTKAKLALGICFLELDNHEKAIEYFDEISEGKSTLKTQAKWYKALYFIKTSQYENAQKTLLEIPNSDKQLFNKSKILLEDLNNLKK